MKRFSFSLERILDLRAFREREAELALGKAVSERERVTLKLQEIAQKRVAASRERATSASVGDLIAIERYVQRLDAEKERRLEELAATELLVERKRAEYVEATKARRVLTKLREKKADVWKGDSLREEAEILDDIANSRDKDGL